MEKSSPGVIREVLAIYTAPPDLVSCLRPWPWLQNMARRHASYSGEPEGSESRKKATRWWWNEPENDDLRWLVTQLYFLRQCLLPTFRGTFFSVTSSFPQLTLLLRFSLKCKNANPTSKKADPGLMIIFLYLLDHSPWKQFITYLLPTTQPTSSPWLTDNSNSAVLQWPLKSGGMVFKENKVRD